MYVAHHYYKLTIKAGVYTLYITCTFVGSNWEVTPDKHVEFCLMGYNWKNTKPFSRNIETLSRDVTPDKHRTNLTGDILVNINPTVGCLEHKR